jgi:hypothetical protein
MITDELTIGARFGDLEFFGATLPENLFDKAGGRQEPLNGETAEPTAT